MTISITNGIEVHPVRLVLFLQRQQAAAVEQHCRVRRLIRILRAVLMS
jgi:hypothetical protein